jgi:hypothetical protein
MKFQNNIADAVSDEEKELVLAAEQKIREMHSHRDGSSIVLHEVGMKDIVGESQLETKLDLPKKGMDAGVKYGNETFNAPDFKPKGETIMMGCRCGAEWTVTGQGNDSNPAGIKVEQYMRSEGESKKYGGEASSQPTYK